MKHLLTIICLILSCNASAQFFWNDTEAFQFGISIDPVASLKENGLNIGGEIELVNRKHYVRLSTQSFSVLMGGYNDLIMTNGINLNYGRFSPIRLYVGGRVGLIFRRGETYPTLGFDAGFNIPITKNALVGLRATYDHRQDMKAFNWPVIWRESGYIVFIYKL